MKIMEGKVALVTGAASGLGLATATAFAEAGYKTLAIKCDVSDDRQVEEMVR